MTLQLIHTLSGSTQPYNQDRANFCLGLTDAILQLTPGDTNPTYLAGYERGKTFDGTMKDFYKEWKRSQCISSM